MKQRVLRGFASGGAWWAFLFNRTVLVAPATLSLATLPGAKGGDRLAIWLTWNCPDG